MKIRFVRKTENQNRMVGFIFLVNREKIPVKMSGVKVRPIKSEIFPVIQPGNKTLKMESFAIQRREKK